MFARHAKDFTPDEHPRTCRALRRPSPPTSCVTGSTTRPSPWSTCGRSPRTTAGAWRRVPRRPCPGREGVPGSVARLRRPTPRSRASSPRRARSAAATSSSTATATRTRTRSRRTSGRRASTTSRRSTAASPPGRRRREPRSTASPSYERLVHVGWLRALLAGESVEAGPPATSLLFHVNFGVPEEYADGHIPGAHFLDTNWLESPVDWNRRSPAELDHALRALGHHRRHDGHPLRPRHRGQPEREVAGPAGGPDRGDARRR